MVEGFFLKSSGRSKRLRHYSHSQSMINLLNNPVYHGRTKHIDVWYHFIRKLLKEVVFLLLKIHTSQIQHIC